MSRQASPQGQFTGDVTEEVGDAEPTHVGAGGKRKAPDFTRP